MKVKARRILFTGGGTAGHVMVNLALIPEFLKLGWKVDYIGSKNGIERELIEPLEDVTYYSISTGKLRRYLSKENLKDPFKVLKGTWEAQRIIRKVKPDVVFSKGGFVSVPVVIGAGVNRVPAIIHESDYTPGLANRLAIPFSSKVLATFPETLKHLPVRKAEWIGAIVREELFTGDGKEGMQICQFHQERTTLLIMGGSSGSKKINDGIRANLEKLLPTFNIIHICGKGNVNPSYNQEGYAQFEYVKDDLKHLLAASDLIISRAGANAIYEFLALRKPMLLIPLSKSVSRGDQILNAHSFEKQGFAHVLEEEDFANSHKLYEEILQLEREKDKIMKSMEKYESSVAKDHVIELIKKTAKS
ncbi:undecaprenyldiphospho-muramoylpentapeptide beta-N-acetylglucosaminyltransferase [Bacillaceae bacterium S4-13-56]